MAEQNFRLHEGGKLGNFAVDLPGILDVGETAERLQEASGITGPLACGLYTDEESETTRLRFVNYPRAKYGNRTVAHIRRTAIDVAQLLGGTLSVPDLGRNRKGQNRAVLGLRRGYEGEELIDPKAVTQAIALPHAMREMHVMSVSPSSIYTEPALEIGFNSSCTLTAICRTAVQFDQERFSLEVPEHGRVFMIETPRCSDIDATPYDTLSARALARQALESAAEA